MKKTKKILALMMTAILLFAVGCGGGSETAADPLKEINQIPENGIITKEQLQTIAGEDKEIQFVETLGEGLSYTWTFNANLIKNPQDQNLKISFENNVLDGLKTQYTDTAYAMKLKMAGKGLVAACVLSVTVPELLEIEEASLVKEENGAYIEVAPATIEKNATDGTTTLKMNLATMEEESFLIGKGGTAPDAATEGEATTEETTTEEKSETTTEKKEETTTVKNPETTTVKKPETTTAKKPETTTAKEAETTTEETKLICTISISCATILDNMDKLDPAKKDFVPSDGWILKKTKVTFEKGESVHDILKRICMEKGIHMESSYTPIYDSAYVEGINQLYEFDCGSESGWMYKVKGWFPNYGCSQYEVSDGDAIEWVYTCNLGDDVGDNSMQ